MYEPPFLSPSCTVISSRSLGPMRRASFIKLKSCIVRIHNFEVLFIQRVQWAAQKFLFMNTTHVLFCEGGQSRFRSFIRSNIEVAEFCERVRTTHARSTHECVTAVVWLSSGGVVCTVVARARERVR